MAILITNDDGIDAPGLAALSEALSGLDDLYISAPATNQSGVGMAISINGKMRATRHPDGPGGVQRHSVTGTPADAVKYGLQQILSNTRPRLVVSGINLGPNLGINIRCSGTVGAAFEAITSGVPALAVSVDYVVPPIWKGAQFYARTIAEKALAMADAGSEAFLLNLNVPSRNPEDIPGLVATRHGIGGIRDFLKPHADNDGSFAMTGEWAAIAPDSDCDMAAFRDGYAVITPMHYDFTHHGFLARMREEWRDCLVAR